MGFRTAGSIVFIAAVAGIVRAATQFSPFVWPMLCPVAGFYLQVWAVRRCRRLVAPWPGHGPKVYGMSVRLITWWLAAGNAVALGGALLAVRGVQLDPDEQTRVVRVMLKVDDSVAQGGVDALSDLGCLVRFGLLLVLLAFVNTLGDCFIFGIWPGPSVVVVSAAGILVRVTPPYINFLPWDDVSEFREAKRLWFTFVLVKLHHPDALSRQRRRLFCWLLQSQRELWALGSGYGFHFGWQGPGGLKAPRLLDELRGYLAQPDTRAELDGPWPDERLRRRFERAQAKWYARAAAATA